MRASRPYRRTALIGAALSLAACGSTVQLAPNNGLAQNGQGLTAPSGSAGQPGALPSGAAGGPGAPAGVGAQGGAQPGTAGSISSGGATAAGATTTSSSGIVAHAPGINATTVYMGISYSSQSAAGDKAIGAGGASPSYDERDVFNAVINYANKHGGFAGRQLKPIYYDYNLTDPQDQQDQAACSFWTQDHKVFAVTPAGKSDVLHACMEKAGGISMYSGNTTKSTYQRYPHFVEPIAMRLDRLAAVTADGLNHAHYFAGKLGLVTWDDPAYRFALQKGMLPALKSHGVTPLQTAYIMVPQTIGAISDMSAAVSSAVTKFRTLGIDHVIIQDGPAGVFSGAGLTFEWMNQSESQGYRPRYGQNANNAPGWTVLPADQQNRAVAIMDSDYDPSYDQGWHQNATRQKCFKIQADAGFPDSSSNMNDEGIASQACDLIFFFQSVMNQLHVITANNFVAQVARLGRSFRSAFVYGTQFAPGLRDGSAAVRQAEYFSSCHCLKYSGAPYYP